jgi:hypothetical protein
VGCCQSPGRSADGSVSTDLLNGLLSLACPAVVGLPRLSFCAAKRAAMEHLPKLSAGTAAAAAGALPEATSTTETGHGHGHMHVSSGHHIHTDHHEPASGAQAQGEGSGAAVQLQGYVGTLVTLGHMT